MNQSLSELKMKYRKQIEDKEFQEVPLDVLVELSKDVLLTTECCPEGLLIEERLDIVYAPAIPGSFFLRDWLASLRDFFGGYSRSAENVVFDATERALRDLRIEAYIRGASGVVAVKLSYAEMSGKGVSMHKVVATGTAVVYRDITGNDREE